MPTKHRGRPRSLNSRKKVQIRDLVAGGANLAEAAIAVGVSTRTIQREARRDPDFDGQLRDAQGAKADPRALMQSAARTHWRAAAWLLEREDPEHYGRRPASSCSPIKFEQALGVVVEAALAATAPEERPAMFEQLHAACQAAFKQVFPLYGPCGARLAPTKPATPLADAERWRHQCDPRRAVPDRDEQGRKMPIRAPRPRAGGEDAPARVPAPAPNRLSAHPLPPDARLPWSYNLRASLTNSAAAEDQDAPVVLSPKTHQATECPGDGNGSAASQEPSAPSAPRPSC